MCYKERQDQKRNHQNLDKSDGCHGEVRRMKGQWAGHAAGMKHSRWAKKVREETPKEGRTERLRPDRERRDEIEELRGSR